jgi:hypothetical protein
MGCRQGRGRIWAGGLSALLSTTYMLPGTLTGNLTGAQTHLKPSTLDPAAAAGGRTDLAAK